jgi:hypothetical protein
MFSTVVTVNSSDTLRCYSLIVIIVLVVSSFSINTALSLDGVVVDPQDSVII